MLCPACAADNPDEDLFCESCGQRLAASPGLAPMPAETVAVSNACPCGSPSQETDADGYCLRCGRRCRTAELFGGGSVRYDHFEEAISPVFAAVSDRGLKHAKNEDRFGILASGEVFAMVVCDGVSTSRDAELASSAVAEGVLESLVRDTQAVGGLADAGAAIRQAIAAGAARARSLAHGDHDENPPSTTVVAALVSGEDATVGWMGDSRAYWIDASGAQALTRDHSWMNAVIATGEMTAELAAKSPQSHAITRWIGADAGSGATEEPEVEIARRKIAPQGMLLLCTDGLWNYYPSAEAMAGIVADAIAADGDALAIARFLVQSANRCGGHDNITAAVLRLGAEDAPTAPIPSPIPDPLPPG